MRSQDDSNLRRVEGSLLLELVRGELESRGIVVHGQRVIRPTGEWVDLIKLLDLKQNVLGNAWEQGRDGALKTIGDPAKDSRVELPLEILGSYMATIEFTRHDGDGPVVLSIPVGDRAVGVYFGDEGAKHHGILYADGKAVISDKLGKLDNKRRYVADLLIPADGQRGHINVRLNGELILKWEGEIAALSQHPSWRMADRRMIGLGAVKGAFSFHQVRLRMLEGLSRQIERTGIVGGGGGGPFTDTPYGSGVLVGIRYTTGNYFGHTIIRSVQAVFRTPDGLRTGPHWGQAGNGPTEVIAKPGYAISSITIRGGDRLDGFQISFMKLTPRGLDPRDKYDSEWQAGTGGGAKTLGGNGQPTVGLHGRSGADIDSLGVVFAPVQNMNMWSSFQTVLRSNEKTNHEQPLATSTVPKANAEAPVPELAGTAIQDAEKQPDERPRPKPSSPGKPTFFGIPVE